MDTRIRERLLRAFLCEVILRLLRHHHETGYQINEDISRKFGLRLGPNLIYTKLSSMERDNLVLCSQHGRTRIYTLAEKGKKTLQEMPEMIEEIRRSTLALLGNGQP